MKRAIFFMICISATLLRVGTSASRECAHRSDGFAHSDEKPGGPPNLARMEHVIQSFVADKQFMGSVLVARGSDVLLDKGYGFANLEWNIPNSPKTKFRKDAYLKDHEMNPGSLDWEFAFAVFTLNCHPMWGLLHWAGMQYRSSSRDQLLLISTALLPVAAVILLAWAGPWMWFQWSGIGCACVAIMFWIYFRSKQNEELRLEKYIDKCRRASRFVGIP